jgi:hypothetical protein
MLCMYLVFLVAFLTSGFYFPVVSFFHRTAISTPDNVLARTAVAQVAKQRGVLNAANSNVTRNYTQKILYNAWEHSEFYQRLTAQGNGFMDEICGGVGYQTLYETYNYTIPHNKYVADILLFTCMLQSGSADGFVKPSIHVQSALLTRGVKGVAAQYIDNDRRKRIRSDFLVLPILSKEEIDTASISSRGAKRQSTVLPMEMTNFLLTTLSKNISWDPQNDFSNFIELWEKFLYTTITREGPSKWILLQAACSDDERSYVGDQPQLIATTCSETATDGGSLSVPDHIENCCSFFDSIEPILL